MKKLFFVIGILLVGSLKVATQPQTVEKTAQAVKPGWKIGTDVQLRSGGPAMTIEAFLPKRKVRCNYLDKDGTFNTAVFDQHDLEILNIKLPEFWDLDNMTYFSNNGRPNYAN